MSNFDLRKFLAENKLTKTAKGGVISEAFSFDADDYIPFNSIKVGMKVRDHYEDLYTIVDKGTGADELADVTGKYRLASPEEYGTDPSEVEEWVVVKGSTPDQPYFWLTYAPGNAECHWSDQQGDDGLEEVGYTDNSESEEEGIDEAYHNFTGKEDPFETYRRNMEKDERYRKWQEEHPEELGEAESEGQLDPKMVLGKWGLKDAKILNQGNGFNVDELAEAIQDAIESYPERKNIINVEYAPHEGIARRLYIDEDHSVEEIASEVEDILNESYYYEGHVTGWMIVDYLGKLEIYPILDQAGLQNYLKASDSVDVAMNQIYGRGSGTYTGD